VTRWYFRPSHRRIEPCCRELRERRFAVASVSRWTAWGVFSHTVFRCRRRTDARPHCRRPPQHADPGALSEEDVGAHQRHVRDTLVKLFGNPGSDESANWRSRRGRNLVVQRPHRDQVIDAAPPSRSPDGGPEKIGHAATSARRSTLRHATAIASISQASHRAEHDRRHRHRRRHLLISDVPRGESESISSGCIRPPGPIPCRTGLQEQPEIRVDFSSSRVARRWTVAAGGLEAGSRRAEGEIRRDERAQEALPSPAIGRTKRSTPPQAARRKDLTPLEHAPQIAVYEIGGVPYLPKYAFFFPFGNGSTIAPGATG